MINNDHPTPPSEAEQADILGSFMRRMDEVDAERARADLTDKREQLRRRKVAEAADRIAQVPLTEHQKHVIRTQLRRTT